MEIRFQATLPDDAAAIALFAEEGLTNPLFAEITGARDQAAAAAAAHFPEGETGAIADLLVPPSTSDKRRLLVVSAGAAGSRDAAAFEKIGGMLAAHFSEALDARVAIDLRGIATAGLSIEDAGAHLAFGAMLRGWTPPSYHTTSVRKGLHSLVIVGATKSAQFDKLQNLAEGIFLARKLTTEPPNKLYPESFVTQCTALSALGVELTVLDETAMEELGMGALLGVAQGSARPPRLLAMHWRGNGTASPLALVGKGITFDSGGISIKPATGMEQMKADMGGAAAVAGVIRALAGAGSPANVVGVVALAENMPSGTALRPSDVVHTMSGKSVEVLNTDCEGRLVLCDALTWVQRTFSPKVVVDIATLTGGVVIALGNEYAGLFANDEPLAEALIVAGLATKERVWRFPMDPAYDRLIDSPIADMKNFDTPQAGSIKAAHFLQRFVEEDVRWAHIDMAGMVWRDSDMVAGCKGATGFGVRLLEYFTSNRGLA